MQTNFIQFSRDTDFYSIHGDIAEKKGKHLLQIEVFKQKGIDKHIFSYLEQKLYELLFEGEHTVFLGKKIEINKHKYFFLADKKDTLEETVHYTMNEFPELSYAVFITKFSKKQIAALIPTILEIQESKNLNTLAELDKNLLQKQQIVVFFMSYNVTNISKYFLESLQQEGFQIEAEGESPREDFEKALKLSKNIFLDAESITGATNTLVTLCENYHFLFEGWIYKAPFEAPPSKGKS